MRKRRNRPDASDEDLGLPRSPASPQRRAVNISNKTSPSVFPSSTSSTSSYSRGTSQLEKHATVSSYVRETGGSQNETSSSFSAISTSSSSERHEEVQVQERTVTTGSRYARSTSMNTDILRQKDSTFPARDEVDLFSSDWQRLSHNAAKHKMAIRPAKKKPSRQHRRTLEVGFCELMGFVYGLYFDVISDFYTRGQ